MVRGIYLASYVAIPFHGHGMEYALSHVFHGRTDLIIMYKDDLTKLRKSLKTEDKQRVELWSTMKLGADEIFQLKLKEAFDLYNIEETEEIGR